MIQCPNAGFYPYQLVVVSRLFVRGKNLHCSSPKKGIDLIYSYYQSTSSYCSSNTSSQLLRERIFRHFYDSPQNHTTRLVASTVFFEDGESSVVLKKPHQYYSRKRVVNQLVFMLQSSSSGSSGSSSSTKQDQQLKQQWEDLPHLRCQDLSCISHQPSAASQAQLPCLALGYIDELRFGLGLHHNDICIRPHQSCHFSAVGVLLCCSNKKDRIFKSTIYPSPFVQHRRERCQ